MPGYRILHLHPDTASKYIQIDCQAIARPPTVSHNARLFPSGQLLKIKSVFFDDDPPSATRLMVRGIQRAAIKSGGMLIPAHLPVYEYREALLLHKERAHRLHFTTESLTGGIHPGFNSEKLIPHARISSYASFIHIRFQTTYPICTGSELNATDPSGQTHHFRVLIPGMPPSIKIINKVQWESGPKGRFPDLRAIIKFNLHTRQFASLPPKEIQEIVSLATDSTTQIDDWLIDTRKLRQIQSQVIKIASQPGGANMEQLKALESKLHEFPSPLILSILKHSIGQGLLCQKGAWYFPADSARLSPLHADCLQRVRGSGSGGLRRSEIRNPVQLKALEHLKQTGLVYGGEYVWISREEFEQLSQQILKGKDAGSYISMIEVKKSTGSSRPLRLELLKALEEEGRLSAHHQSKRRIK